MVVTDFESESIDSLVHPDDFRVFIVSKNCRGYVVDSSVSNFRRSVIRGGAKVKYEGETHVITCPKFAAGLDSHVCMFPGYNTGARKHLCSNGNHVKCATYDKSIGQKN
ncbi:hypothetical protein GOV12_08160 [Candidatus Pacearchaeota archaeon]|nr:hypothetical protein [Candidatus Pacearchaeota archaeon]